MMDKTIKVLWSNIDMRRVVLRANSYVRRLGYRETLGEYAEIPRFAREGNRQEDNNKSPSKNFSHAHSISPKSPIPSSL